MIAGRAVVAAALVLAGGILAAVIVRRRREPAFEIPDTIPDELERESNLRF